MPIRCGFLALRPEKRPIYAGGLLAILSVRLNSAAAGDRLIRTALLGHGSQRGVRRRLMRSPTADPALETLSVPETARLMGVSPRHAYRMAEVGKLPGAFRLGSVVRVNKAALMAWQAALVAAAQQRALGPTA